MYYISPESVGGTDERIVVLSTDDISYRKEMTGADIIRKYSAVEVVGIYDASPFPGWKSVHPISEHEARLLHNVKYNGVGKELHHGKIQTIASCGFWFYKGIDGYPMSLAKLLYSNYSGDDSLPKYNIEIRDNQIYVCIGSSVGYTQSLYAIYGIVDVDGFWRAITKYKMLHPVLETYTPFDVKVM